jgi:hypothetical protein
LPVKPENNIRAGVDRQSQKWTKQSFNVLAIVKLLDDGKCSVSLRQRDDRVLNSHRMRAELVCLGRGRKTSILTMDAKHPTSGGAGRLTVPASSRHIRLREYEIGLDNPSNRQSKLTSHLWACYAVGSYVFATWSIRCVSAAHGPAASCESAKGWTRVGLQRWFVELLPAYRLMARCKPSCSIALTAYVL